MSDFGCSASFFMLASFVMAAIALSRSKPAENTDHSRMQAQLDALGREVQSLWKKVRALERDLEELRAAREETDPGVLVAKVEVPTSNAPIAGLDDRWVAQLEASKGRMPVGEAGPTRLSAAAAPGSEPIRPEATSPSIEESLPAAFEVVPVPATESMVQAEIESGPPFNPSEATAVGNGEVDRLAAPLAQEPHQPEEAAGTVVPEPFMTLEGDLAEQEANATGPEATASPEESLSLPVAASIVDRSPALALPEMQEPIAENLKPAPTPSPSPTLAALPPRRMPQLPPLPSKAPPPNRNLEDFLGTQLFLKAGVAILVIGVVFAMGIVFQKMGPAGKLLMGYAGALAMLGGGLFAERKPRYQTFGRAIIAGAWGILYFVTYAGGYIEASKVFTSPPVAIIALLVAATAAVAFSLRYRNEWTTTSAFLLIFLGLGMAAWDLEPTFNLTATAIVALAMAVLVWKTGWVRLLGFGVPATWGTLSFWIIRRPHLAGEAGLMGTLLLCWAAFQLILIFFDGEEEREKWIGLSQIGNFLGGFGLCLHQTLPDAGAKPWVWAAGFGLANLGVAWAYARRGRREMYLLAATEGLAALALVTPLRLGWKHHLTPVYRMVGLEMLLLGGVVLKEKYFRRVAYGAFAVTLLEILFLKLDPSLGVGRTLLLGTAAGIWLLDAVLLRTVWWVACQTEDDGFGEFPMMPHAFGVAGTLMVGILIWIEAPLKVYGGLYALLAVLWLALGWLKGYKDALALSPILGLASTYWAIQALRTMPGDPGTVPARWVGAFLAAALLAFGAFFTGKRRSVHESIQAEWQAALPKFFGLFAIAITWVLLFTELPLAWRATGFAAFAVGLMAVAVFQKFIGLTRGALCTLLAAFGLLLIRPGELRQMACWHVTGLGWSVLSVSAAAYAIEGLVRSFRGRTLLSEAEWETSRWVSSLMGLGLLVYATFTELPDSGRATGVAVLAVLHLGFALWRQHKDRAYEAVALLGFALWILFALPASWQVKVWHISLHGWSYMGVGALTFLFEWLVRRPSSEAFFSTGFRVGLTRLVSLSGLVLACLVLRGELPSTWTAVAFGLAALVCLLLGLLWSHRDKAYASYALLGLALLTLWFRPAVWEPGFWHVSIWAWTLLGVSATAYALEFVTRRKATRLLFGGEGRFQAGATLYTSLSGLGLVVLVHLKETSDPWIAVGLGGLALLHLALGILWSHKDRAYEAFGLLVMAMVVLGVQPASTTMVWAHVSAQGWTLLGVCSEAFLMEAMVRIPASQRVLEAPERQTGLWLTSLSGTGLALVFIWTEAPDAWIAPLMTALSVVLLLLGLLLGFKEQVAGSVLTGLAGLGAVASLQGALHEDWLHVSLRAWNFGIIAGLSLGQELLLRAWKRAWKWSEDWFRWLTWGHSLKAVGFLMLLALFEFKPVWVPGSLMLFGCLWMVWGWKKASVLHAGEAFAFGLLSCVVMITMLTSDGWHLGGARFGLPERMVSVGLGLLLAYLLQHLIHLAAEEKLSGPDERLSDLLDLGLASGISLSFTTLVVAIFVKIEASAHGQEAWVPLFWGALAMLYFVRGRALIKAMWPYLGHGLMGLGLIHLLLLNLPLDKSLHGLSLRVWTCLPFLGMLGSTYGVWRWVHEEVVESESRILRYSYFFAAQIVLAGMLLFELDRPWVVSAWAIQALATLLVGVYRNDVPWLRAALLLATVATLRAFLINFPEWDAASRISERLVVIPLACGALLAGYLRLRHWDPAAEEGDSEFAQRALLEGRHRLPWFSLLSVLLIAYIWLEGSGTSLTVWATIYGFGMVGIGFMYRERVARLLGLAVLSGCTLKLFLWDLRGLQGLARVGSFIVLGIVLISVSYVYTRFKERIVRLL